MRSIPLRPGETFVIGDTAISAEQSAAEVSGDLAIPMSAAPTNPIQHQSTQQWLAAYEREERRLAAARVRVGPGDI